MVLEADLCNSNHLCMAAVLVEVLDNSHLCMVAKDHLNSVEASAADLDLLNSLVADTVCNSLDSVVALVDPLCMVADSVVVMECNPLNMVEE